MEIKGKSSKKIYWTYIVKEWERSVTMKNRKVIILFSILLILIISGGYFGIQYVERKEEEEIAEYTPQEEITEEQARQTIVSLYFVENETGELSPEARLVDIKDLMNSPYEKLVNLLIEGPKNKKFSKLIPENTKLLKTNIDGDCLILDMTSDFLLYNKEDSLAKDNLVNSIVNTVTELTEINKVKFLIEGNENEELSEIYTRKV